jgi:hypothetical protein
MALIATLLGGLVVTRSTAAAAVLHWHAANLLNGWVPYPSLGAGPPQFTLDSNTSLVYFRGAVSNGGAGSLIIFKLPAPYRPTRTVYITTNLANAETGRIKIEANGNVSVEATANDTNAAKGFTSLEGIVFSR